MSLVTQRHLLEAAIDRNLVIRAKADENIQQLRSRLEGFDVAAELIERQDGSNDTNDD